MTRIKYYLILIGANIRISFLQFLEYPAGVLGWLISNPIQFVLGYATIQFVVNRFGTINGWNYGELAFLFGLAVISHALSVILFSQCWFLSYYIIEGDFDRYLLRPASVLFQFLMNEINIIGFTDLIPGLCVFVYGCIKVGFHCSIASISSIVVVLLGATLIRGGVYLAVGSLAFWTKGIQNFSSLTQELFNKTTQYPLTMYPRGIQFLLTFIIPIGWVSFFPAGELIGKSVTFGWAGSFITLAIGMASLFVAGLCFTYSLRKYESAGS